MCLPGTQTWNSLTLHQQQLGRHSLTCQRGKPPEERVSQDLSRPPNTPPRAHIDGASLKPRRQPEPQGNTNADSGPQREPGYGLHALEHAPCSRMSKRPAHAAHKHKSHREASVPSNGGTCSKTASLLRWGAAQGQHWRDLLQNLPAHTRDAGEDGDRSARKGHAARTHGARCQAAQTASQMQHWPTATGSALAIPGGHTPGASWAREVPGVYTKVYTKARAPQGQS